MMKKTLNWTKEEIDKTVALCKKEAMTNGAFRAKILKDPAAAIRELTGKEIPDGLRLQILEQDPKADMAFVLPPPLPEELTDEELNGSVGGCHSPFEKCDQYSGGILWGK